MVDWRVKRFVVCPASTIPRAIAFGSSQSSFDIDLGPGAQRSVVLSNLIPTDAHIQMIPARSWISDELRMWRDRKMICVSLDQVQN